MKIIFPTCFFFCVQFLGKEGESGWWGFWKNGANESFGKVFHIWLKKKKWGAKSKWFVSTKIVPLLCEKEKKKWKRNYQFRFYDQETEKTVPSYYIYTPPTQKSFFDQLRGVCNRLFHLFCWCRKPPKNNSSN